MKLFVTGIDTEVGKTVCSAVLTRYFKADYWKPVQSGDLLFSDTMKVSKWTEKNVFCHPETYCLQLAASPHHSASEEGIRIDIEEFSVPDTSNHLIIEGAGGLLVPLNDRDCMIDLVKKLDVPVALVVRNYLGCINHSLLSVMALGEKQIRLEYLILNGDFPTETQNIILKHIPVGTKIIRIPEIKDLTKESIDHTVTLIKTEYNEFK
ncbi:dethiobiotin synthase [Chryseobacterium sp. SSA4.19]|uniref:dethiobiotin synthase n=1 Tax=Chryseobacterium sp. SSA4.19 TaxID=2919915 RepID=UPI001F4E9125|nr:dethiobiotin synthase [Chryseobacterium sp. SSA4.19]MCJ8153408.1 dethiobiotin synthase [Chryseobacterium sp. SSA4.19]